MDAINANDGEDGEGLDYLGEDGEDGEAVDISDFKYVTLEELLAVTSDSLT